MRKHLQPNKNVDNVVEIKPYDSIAGFLSDMKNVTIWLSNNASQALVSLCSPNKTILECTPVTLAKAIKNPVEIQGFKSCHVRDGLVQKLSPIFLKYMLETKKTSNLHSFF